MTSRIPFVAAVVGLVIAGCTPGPEAATSQPEPRATTATGPPSTTVAPAASAPSTITPTTAAPSTTRATTTTSAFVARSEHEACLERAVFGDPAGSPYVLPFPAGSGSTMFQGYCRDDTSHEGQLAYDFLMPIGSPVVAARSGVVKEVKEDVADDAFTSALNFVLVEHDDGTVAFYAHLTKDGVLPEVGQRVEQGEQIARSGSSGRTGELLHFGVYRSYPPREGADLAVSFSNADGPLDDRGGLRDGTYYRALD